MMSMTTKMALQGLESLDKRALEDLALARMTMGQSAITAIESLSTPSRRPIGQEPQNADAEGPTVVDWLNRHWWAMMTIQSVYEDGLKKAKEAYDALYGPKWDKAVRDILENHLWGPIRGEAYEGIGGVSDNVSIGSHVIHNDTVGRPHGGQVAADGRDSMATHSASSAYQPTTNTVNSIADKSASGASPVDQPMPHQPAVQGPGTDHDSHVIQQGIVRAPPLVPILRPSSGGDWSKFLGDLESLFSETNSGSIAHQSHGGGSCM